MAETPAPWQPSAAPRAPRDTSEYVRDVARDLEGLGKHVTERLRNGSESFGALRAEVEEAKRKADAANSAAVAAAGPKRIPWTRVIPVAVLLAGTAAGVVGAIVRVQTRDLVDERAEALGERLRSLEGEIVNVQKELIALRAALDSLREVTSRRLDVVERASSVPRRPK